MCCSSNLKYGSEGSKTLIVHSKSPYEQLVKSEKKTLMLGPFMLNDEKVNDGDHNLEIISRKTRQEAIISSPFWKVRCESEL